ncbi:hypothetical protein [Streptomyces sp. SID13726]|uniref:hypothetical protein n=1 Tax=Streptomyces sp. SID13726 TaxID=2706058 RepID=UPI0013BB96B3|nr:hypothetical protein [Streptomyces sp. SID13726]NEA99800.1 hypothetical protein [Streptomyces sp. SID13726]
MMHEVVLPGQGVTHHCPICRAPFTGMYGWISKQRWKKAQKEGPAAVAALLFDAKSTVNHKPTTCPGRFLPGCVLANEPDPRKAEAEALKIQQTYFGGTAGGTPPTA